MNEQQAAMNRAATILGMPAAIYVWLVPGETVLEQPGEWRIRKWDTAPFPEANFTLAPSSETKPCPLCNPATLYANPANTRAEAAALQSTRKRCANCPYPHGCIVGDCDE